MFGQVENGGPRRMEPHTNGQDISTASSYCCLGRVESKRGVVIVAPFEICLWACIVAYYIYVTISGQYENGCAYIMQEAANFIQCHKLFPIICIILAIRGLALILLIWAYLKESATCVLLVLAELTLRMAFQLSICLILTIATVCNKRWYWERPYLERVIILWVITIKDVAVFSLFVAHYRFISEESDREDNVDEFTVLRHLPGIGEERALSKRRRKTMNQRGRYENGRVRLIAIRGSEDLQEHRKESRISGQCQSPIAGLKWNVTRV